jgi:membrane protein required for colicin V production
LILDLITILVVSIGFYLGFKRGILKTIFDIVSILLGIFAALKFSPLVINFLNKLDLLHTSINFVLGIALCFAGLMIFIRFIGKRVEDLLKTLNINIFNRFAGGAVQSLVFALMLSYFVGLLDRIEVLSPTHKMASSSYHHLMVLPEASEALFGKLKPIFHEFSHAFLTTIDSNQLPNSEM